ncbi:MAG TPA: hypothetical protein VFU03_09775, partial [Gemmatimonadales bacterium]|nr:hypothetical protein [Gemmatimonadales bacterium]
GSPECPSHCGLPTSLAAPWSWASHGAVSEVIKESGGTLGVVDVALGNWGAQFGHPKIFVSLVDWADRVITE